jgi:hypothetical protein
MMNDQELDALIASLAISGDQVAKLDLASADTDLREVIMSTPVLDHVHGDGGSRSAPPTPRWLRRLPQAVATAAVIALALIIVQPFGRGGTTPRAWAEAVVEAAENGPLLLVGESGWAVTRADIYGETEGEMRFRNGSTDVDLHWRDPAGFEDWVDERAHSADHQETLQVLGHEAQLFRYAGSGGDYTTLFRDGRHVIEVRGRFDSLDAYKQMLASLERVDVDTWLSAMPESVIASSDRATTVRGMLRGLPLPEGFDAAALEEGRLRDRYQLGAVVAGSVACAWLDQWVAATEAGDDAAAVEAVAALQTSHDWSVLHEMKAQGYYPQVLWEYADAVAGDGTIMGGRELTVAESYNQALGCGQES